MSWMKTVTGKYAVLLSRPRHASRNLERHDHDSDDGDDDHDDGDSDHDDGDSDHDDDELGHQPDGGGGRALVDQGLQRLGENNRHVASVDLAEREESIRPTLQRKEMREREIFCALENQFHIHLEKSPFLIHLLGKP